MRNAFKLLLLVLILCTMSASTAALSEEWNVTNPYNWATIGGGYDDEGFRMRASANNNGIVQVALFAQGEDEPFVDDIFLSANEPFDWCGAVFAVKAKKYSGTGAQYGSIWPDCIWPH